MSTTKVPASLPVPNFRKLQKKTSKESHSFFASRSQAKTMTQNKEELAQLDTRIMKVEQEIKRTRSSS